MPTTRKAARIEGRASDYVRTGDGGSRCTFHFCPECGATVYYELEDVTDAVAIPIGAFADPTFPPPRGSVYEARQHPWVTISAEVEHLDECAACSGNNNTPVPLPSG